MIKVGFTFKPFDKVGYDKVGSARLAQHSKIHQCNYKKTFRQTI